MDIRFKKMIGIIWMFLMIGNVTGGLAAVDCYIQPWGAPPYQTPDIWTDNDGDGVQECGEPSRGIVNRLYARIHNIGTTNATNVQVTFFYAPYSAGYPHTHFKQIGIPATIFNLAVGGNVPIEVAWDLSNLSEDNGGRWPSPISAFNHFCVRVVIECASDVNPGNNEAQNNFTEVLCSDCGFNFVIANPTAEHVSASLITSGLPEDWHMNITAPGIKNIREFGLAPHETKLARLELSHPNVQDEMSKTIDVGLKLNGELKGGFTFRTVTATAPSRRFNSLSFHVGRVIPTGAYADSCNSGYSLTTDIDYHLSNQLSAVLLVGYNNLMARSPSIDDVRWWNISGNLKMEFIVSSTINLCLNAGSGVYFPLNGSSKAGFNVGLGWNYSLANDCRLEFKHDYHRVQGNTKAEFIVTQIGVVFRY